MFRSLFTAKGRVGKSDYVYYTPGSYTFNVPANVYYISAVCVGGGGGGTGANVFSPNRGAGAGGDLVHATLPVTPGESLTVVVGDGGAAGAYRGGYTDHGESSGIKRGSTFILKAKGGKGGGNPNPQDSNVIDADATRSAQYSGGAGGDEGAGGAAGYSGNGGAGGGDTAQSGSGGGGGGGADTTYTNYRGGQGGGVYLYGEGSSGAGGVNDGVNWDGEDGSGDAPGKPSSALPVGDGGFARTTANTGQPGGAGGSGGVRIVLPGQTSFFPSTDVGA